MSGLTPARVSMRDAPTEVQIRVRKRLVAHPFVRERSSCGCDSRARPKVSGQVLADESRHLEHVETFAKKSHAFENEVHPASTRVLRGFITSLQTRRCSMVSEEPETTSTNTVHHISILFCTPTRLLSGSGLNQLENSGPKTFVDLANAWSHVCRDEIFEM